MQDIEASPTASMPKRVLSIAAPEWMPGLLRELAGETTRSAVVAAVVRFWHGRGMAAAGWLSDRDGDGLRIVTTRGFHRSTDERLRRNVDVTNAEAIVRTATPILGRLTPLLPESGDAVVVITGSEVDRSDVETVEAGLGLALERLALSETVAGLTSAIDSGLAWTAHELRGPLLGVVKAIESFATASTRLPLRERDVLAAAQVELRRLAETVDDVLRWSVGAASIRRRPIDLAELVEEAAWSVIGEHDRHATVDASQAAMVCGDPQLLRIAIVNLIRNAVEHTHDDIRVTVDVTAADVTVNVADSGPGVSPDRRATIFDPFVRGFGAQSDGRGLGLFIAQRVVQAHGGTLWLESGSSGAVFRMRFSRLAP